MVGTLLPDVLQLWDTLLQFPLALSGQRVLPCPAWVKYSPTLPSQVACGGHKDSTVRSRSPKPSTARKHFNPPRTLSKLTSVWFPGLSPSNLMVQQDASSRAALLWRLHAVIPSLSVPGWG